MSNSNEEYCQQRVQDKHVLLITLAKIQYYAIYNFLCSGNILCRKWAKFSNTGKIVNTCQFLSITQRSVVVLCYYQTLLTHQVNIFLSHLAQCVAAKLVSILAALLHTVAVLYSQFVLHSPDLTLSCLRHGRCVPVVVKRPADLSA